MARGRRKQSRSIASSISFIPQHCRLAKQIIHLCLTDVDTGFSQEACTVHTHTVNTWKPGQKKVSSHCCYRLPPLVLISVLTVLSLEGQRTDNLPCLLCLSFSLLTTPTPLQLGRVFSGALDWMAFLQHGALAAQRSLTKTVKSGR